MVETNNYPPRLVRDLMTVGVLTCGPATSLANLARLFLESGIQNEIVVLDEGHGIGVVGQQEVIAACLREQPCHLTAADVMREGVPQIPPDIPLEAAAQVMNDLGVRSLYLMHHAGGVEYPAAVISYWHFLRYLVAEKAEDLSDLGIYAQRKAPLDAFIQKRDDARRRAASRNKQ